MRVLALSTSRNFSVKRLLDVRTKLALGDDVEIDLVTVYPPRGRLPVHRVECVDPSVIPWRPLVPVGGDAARRWTGPRREVVRLLRLVRAATTAIRPQALRVQDATFLAIAGATSPDLARRAREADVVVAVDARAARAAWHLARRVDGPAVVYGAANVRRVLLSTGRPVAGGAADLAAPSQEREHVVPAPELPAAPVAAARTLLIAPANYAGQAHAWARAVREHVPGATALNLRAGEVRIPFATDYMVATAVFNGSLHWRTAWRSFVKSWFSHVIVEANRPVLGAITGDGRQHVAELRREGKQVALLSHGSDGRIPSMHAARERWHSYDALDGKSLNALEERSRTNVAYYNGFSGTVFVSTLGLLEFIPAGTWLPLTVDPDAWRQEDEPMQRAVPVVAHIPSSAQKGSHLIDPVLRSMHDRGAIEYRRVEHVPHSRMPELYGTADIVVEQFGIADYSVAACEAMAAGRVVVSRVADAVRRRVLDATGMDLPVVEANPETLEQVVLDLVRDRDAARDVARQGHHFVREVHDGRRAARVLSEWLEG